MISYEELETEFGFSLWPEGDRPKGRIGSAMPAWYYDTRVSEEYAALNDQQSIMDRGGVSPENQHRIRQQTLNEQRKLDQIKDSFPKPRAADLDNLRNIWKELGDTISESMFTLSDMKSGAASPHEELRRSKDTVVPITRGVARWVIYCNGKIEGVDSYKCKRDDLIRAWKLAGRILGEGTWAEDLRPATRTTASLVGAYRKVFTGYDAKQTEEVKMDERATVFDAPVVKNADIVCVECGASMEGEHPAAKRCKACREARNGRKNPDTDVGGDA